VSEENFSIDSIWDSSLQIQQSRKGYRFALDAVLLAHFLRIDANEIAFEIGCGNGVIPILLSRLKKFRKIVAIEIQSELADLARSNVERNHAERIEIIHDDAMQLREKFPPNSFDLLYSNPPYRKLGSGKLNALREKAIARHEVHLKLENLVSLADYFLKPEGRVSVILPTFREQDWMKLLSQHKYHLIQRQYVHSFRDEAAAFVLATACRISKQLEELEALVIYEKPGEYTEEMAKLLTKPAG
jgi:tRNA1Val (adenine37-N6)-methyltransferase